MLDHNFSFTVLSGLANKTIHLLVHVHVHVRVTSEKCRACTTPQSYFANAFRLLLSMR